MSSIELLVIPGTILSMTVGAALGKYLDQRTMKRNNSHRTI